MSGRTGSGRPPDWLAAWDKESGDAFDWGALPDFDQRDRDRRTLHADLARIGARLPPGAPPPRTTAHPPSGPTLAIPGLSGPPTQEVAPGDRWHENYPVGRGMPEERPVAAPGRKGIYPVLDRLIEKLKENCICTIAPPWIHPPACAIAVDLYTNGGGVHLQEDPNPGTATLLTINVPDRMIVVLNRFGQAVEDVDDWTSVTWSMLRNRSPVRSYGNINVQIGLFTEPTPLAAPIILRGNDRFKVMADWAGDGDTYVWARIQGWAVAMADMKDLYGFKEIQVGDNIPIIGPGAA